MIGEKKNIFEIGRIATGDSFIGRKKLLNEYYNMVYGSGRKPCLSIIGVTRSGKTSFVKKLLEYECEDTLKIYIDLGTLRKFKDLWSYTIQKCKTSFKILNKNVNVLESIGNELKSTEDYILIKELVESFFEYLSSIKMRLILVLDEFDAATDVFKGDFSSFEFCREIFSNGNYLLTAIVVSRKMLATIVAETYQTSTFSGIFYTQYFKGFDTNDLNEYWDIFNNEEIILTDDQKKDILYYAGNSPYLLSIIGYNIINNVNTCRTIDIDRIFQNDCKQINEYYRSIIHHLERDCTKNKLISIVVGPNYNITRQDKEDLRNLGYLLDNPNENAPFIAFSKYFNDFLSIEQNANNPIWPELIATEKLLKQIIRKELEQIYSIGEVNNQKKLIQSILISNVDDTMNMLDSFIKDVTKKFGKKDVDYIDVISLKHSFDIIKKYWIEIFSRYFGYDDISNWEYKFKACGRARNPIAHGHEDYLTRQECSQVTSYCDEIQKLIKKYTIQKADSEIETDKTNIDVPKHEKSTVFLPNLKNEIETTISNFDGKTICHGTLIEEKLSGRTQLYALANGEKYLIIETNFINSNKIQHGNKICFKKKIMTNDKGQSKVFAIDVKEEN